MFGFLILGLAALAMAGVGLLTQKPTPQNPPAPPPPPPPQPTPGLPGGSNGTPALLLQPNVTYAVQMAVPAQTTGSALTALTGAAVLLQVFQSTLAQNFQLVSAPQPRTPQDLTNLISGQPSQWVGTVKYVGALPIPTITSTPNPPIALTWYALPVS